MESKEDYEDPRFRRHINPDGTEGGLVNKSAQIASTVYIGKDARVSGACAKVTGNVRILDKAQVSGTLEGNAIVKDTAVVSYGTTVKDDAILSGRSIVDSRNTVVGGDTHFHDIELYGPDLQFSGGSFQGKHTIIGASNLYYDFDGKGNINRLYLWTGKEESLQNEAELLKYVAPLKNKILRGIPRDKGIAER